jgi:hypothetical protein
MEQASCQDRMFEEFECTRPHNSSTWITQNPNLSQRHGFLSRFTSQFDRTRFQFSWYTTPGGKGVVSVQSSKLLFPVKISMTRWRTYTWISPTSISPYKAERAYSGRWEGPYGGYVPPSFEDSLGEAMMMSSDRDQLGLEPHPALISVGASRGHETRGVRSFKSEIYCTARAMNPTYTCHRMHSIAIPAQIECGYRKLKLFQLLVGLP